MGRNEIMKNKEPLEEWTDMLEELEKAQLDLTSSSQFQCDEKSHLRLEGLKSAIQNQKEILRQMRILSRADENMKKLNFNNFAARLRNIAKNENELLALNVTESQEIR